MNYAAQALALTIAIGLALAAVEAAHRVQQRATAEALEIAAFNCDAPLPKLANRRLVSAYLKKCT